MPNAPQFDLTGQRFGHLVVLAYGRHRGQGAWQCRCDCGTVLFVMSGSLRAGRTRSCGCSFRLQAMSEHRAEHGHSKAKDPGGVYGTWCHLRARCRDPNDPAYKNYGGRGITVCGAWDKDFTAFLADVGPRPGPEYSLDRIDVNGNYEPGNVRWATRRQQVINRRPVNRGANSTGFRGVTYAPVRPGIRNSERWHVRIAIEGKVIHLASCADLATARILAREAFLIRDALFPEWL